MKALARRETLALLLGAVCIALPHRVAAQTFTLDPQSTSLAAIPATAGTLLAPAAFKIPAASAPVIGFTNAQLGLLPGDVIDAVTFGNDGAPGSTLTFTVSRSSTGAGAGPKTPDVFSEGNAVPPGTQRDAAGSLFTTADPACAVVAPFNTQIVDGNGAALAGPPLTCYPTLGLGLAELLAAPGPPLNDAIAAFEWSLPGTAVSTGMAFSLAPGSPTLTPGNNPLLPAGAQPGDVIVSFPSNPPTPPALGVFVSPTELGLISGAPACAPPACDDIDALSVNTAGPILTFRFSLAPGSPSLGACGYSPADILGGVPPLTACAPPFLTASAIGLAVADNVTGLEFFTNPCPVAPGSGSDPDGDGVGLCDTCPTVFNPGTQADDFDSDGTPDACDPCTDTDGDGFGNRGFPGTCSTTPDLCPNTAGPNVDSDGDGVADECDNCDAVVNPSQTDSDSDGIGNACDICASGPDTPDTDGDLIPDACDPCSGGVGMLKAQVKLGKLQSGPNTNQLQLQGTLLFPATTLPLPPLDVINKGMHVRLDDLGNGAVLLDYVIPAGPVPQCGPKDGWKTNSALTSQKYLNKTNQDPTAACAAGSAVGITGAQAQDKTAKLKGATFKVKGKNGNYGPAVGPVRLTVVLGGTAEGAGGQCSQLIFPPANCVLSGGGKTLKCKQ